MGLFIFLLLKRWQIIKNIKKSKKIYIYIFLEIFVSLTAVIILLYIREYKPFTPLPGELRLQQTNP